MSNVERSKKKDAEQTHRFEALKSQKKTFDYFVSKKNNPKTLPFWEKSWRLLFLRKDGACFS